ncbi:protein THEM6 [Halyomorpha halys]|uniref:protein THEM6 n=1 Tax=Halyomorpha halys TaxID=286706 RepID=UPI0006D4F808|nr:protein THEM6 [Halyomorpha halys]
MNGKNKGLCLTTDVDYLLSHMNNARFLRELDFARADFYQRTGLYGAIQGKGGAVVQGAATIRYRKFVRLCSFYSIVSKIIYWEGSSIYMEHRFVSPTDDFVLAIAICRQRLLKVESEDLIREIMSSEKSPESGGYTKPEMPMDLAKWVESNEISSANLRNGC